MGYALQREKGENRMIITYVISHPKGNGKIEVELESEMKPSQIPPDVLDDEVLGYIEDDLFTNISIKKFDYSLDD